MNTAEFAARIKAKYPDYANVPDADLVQKILAKHPEYASVVDAPTATQPSPEITSLEAPSFGQEMKDAFINTPIQGAIGALKGLGHTAYSLGDLVNMAANKAADYTISPELARRVVNATVGDRSIYQGQNDITRALQPSNVQQKIGYGAEQVGEFLVPGMAESGALAPVAKLLGTSPLGKPSLLSNIVTGAATSGGVAAAQGDNPVVGAVAGAASPVVAKGLVSTARTFLNGLVGAMPSAFKGGANPGLSMIDEGVMGATKGGFLRGIKEAQDRTMAKLGAVLGRSPLIHDATDAITGPIDDAIQNAKSFPQQATMLTNLKTQLLDIPQTLSLGKVNALNSTDLNLLRNAVDDVRVAGIGDANVPPAVTNALKDVSRNMNTMLDGAAPGAKYLNHQYGNLREAEKMFVAKIARNNSQMGRLAMDVGISTVPAIHDLSEGNYASAAKKAGLTFALTQGLQSPAVISPLAQGLAHVAAPAVKALGPGIASVLLGGGDEQQPSEPPSPAPKPQRKADSSLHDSHIGTMPPENADVLDSTPPQKVLPSRFKTALSAEIAMPRYVGAVSPDEATPNGWYGAYGGMGFSGTGDKPSILVSRASKDQFSSVLYHELGHGAWNDLTRGEQGQIEQHARSLWNNPNYDEGSQIEKILKENTSHGEGGGTEFFSELFSMYVANPSTLKGEDPSGYALMRQIFGGKEYIRSKKK